LAIATLVAVTTLTATTLVAITPTITTTTTLAQETQELKAKRNLPFSTLNNIEDFFRIKLQRRKEHVMYVNG